LIPRLPAIGKWQRWTICGLLFLASIHCTVSMFCSNYSYLDLTAYASGAELMPYQGRVAMMWILRAAKHSAGITAAAQAIDNDLRARHKHSALIGLTPEKLVCMGAGFVSMLMMTCTAIWYGQRRFRQLWWLPATLMLIMFYVTYAARYETALWYPYDLPHFAVFGIACLAILEGAWWPAIILFAIDMPIRETAIFLALVSFAVAWARGERKKGVFLAGSMFALWVPFRLYIARVFAHNGSETGVHYHRLRESVMNPIHWPQTLSAFGFLLIPLWWGRKRLSRVQRYFLLGTIPCLLATLAFAVWSETRVFDEWILPFAALVTAECATWFSHNRAARADSVEFHDALEATPELASTWR
jgi:hypothetical protein